MEIEYNDSMIFDKLLKKVGMTYLSTRREKVSLTAYIDSYKAILRDVESVISQQKL